MSATAETFPGTVRDGETGLLAEPGNAADFAEKIARIWTDHDLARRLGRNARRHVELEFSHQAHFDRLMRVNAEVIAYTESAQEPQAS